MKRREATLLAAVLRDPHWRVRAAAAQALACLGGGAAAPHAAALAEALRDGHWQVREAAARALGALGGAAAAHADALAPLIEDGCWLVRQVAADALRTLGATEVASGLRQEDVQEFGWDGWPSASEAGQCCRCGAEDAVGGMADKYLVFMDGFLCTACWEATSYEMSSVDHAQPLQPAERAARGVRPELLAWHHRAGIVVLADRANLFNVGGAVWHASELAVDFLTANPSIVSGRRVVEVGAGCGLLGMVAALRCDARSVVLTDLAQVCPLLEANVAAHFGWAGGSSSPRGRDAGKGVPCDGDGEHCAAATLPSRPVVEPLLWGSQEEARRVLQHGPFDVVLGSDVVYNMDLAEPLLETLEALASDGALVLLSQANRGNCVQGFHGLAQERGWSFRVLAECHSQPFGECNASANTFVHHNWILGCEAPRRGEQ